MKNRIVFSLLGKLVILSAISVGSAFGQNWKPSTGNVQFKIKMLMSNVTGKLGGLAANLSFENGEPKSIYATVNTATVNTDNKLRDKHLKEKVEFFQPAKYPVVKMKSKQITKTSKGYQAEFDITIKDVTKSQLIDFQFTEDGNTGKLTSTFTLNRNKWNFGGNTMGMGDDVQVNIALNVTK